MREPLSEAQKEDQLIKVDRKKASKKLNDIVDDRFTKLKDRSKCYDIFWNLKLGEKRMFKQNNIKSLVKYRVRQKLKQTQIS